MSATVEIFDEVTIYSKIQAIVSFITKLICNSLQLHATTRKLKINKPQEVLLIIAKRFVSVSRRKLS
jgi:hypothetical protein